MPVGRNPWRGPPVPYDTPVTNGLNVLPPNKFPYIPPGADPDPGIPDRRAAPSGCGARARAGTDTSRRTIRRRRTTAGRRRATRRGCRRGFRRFRPSFRIRSGCRRRHRRRVPGRRPKPGPAPGPQPQASGTAYTTYDQQTGAFRDPAGGTGIFAPGASGASSAENWVDLMLDPRPL